jgi:hypothetical protein
MSAYNYYRGKHYQSALMPETTKKSKEKKFCRIHMLEVKSNILKIEFGFNFFCLLAEKGEVTSNKPALLF